MKIFNTTAYTPETIGSIKFRIPLYQRPYAWEILQVEQLLKDLYAQFNKDKDQKYFIGILSVGCTDNNELFDLIDGQQRITTLTLIGKVLLEYHSLWNNFLNNRLDLYGRKEDQLYLDKNDVSLAPNRKLVEAIGVIEKFIDTNIIDTNKFAQYVFENAAFFISKVPDHYTLIDKNLQFVRMNNRGKQLESHDVLKIKLASEIADSNLRNKFIKDWNVISQLGCSNLNFDINEEKSLKDLLDPKETFTEPGKETEIFYQSILTFPEFLLIALQRFFMQMNSDVTVSHQKDKQFDEYRKDRLIEEFGFGEKDVEFTWSEESTLKFFELLETQFQLFDKYIIKRDKEEKYKFSGDKDKLTGSSLLELQVFQSFLYVTREPFQNNWLVNTFDFLGKNTREEKIDTKFYLEFLKNLDNEKCVERNLKSIEYRSIDRYWFWRLDYYLWEKRADYFTGKSLDIAAKYVFRVNRSIEHIAPQTPKSNSCVSLDGSLMNSFGNLAMISSGQNSSLQNESFEIKHAHVMSFINGSLSGSIESLKMLHIYQYDKWNDENLTKHSDIMLNVLMDSFPEDYAEIKQKFQDKISPDEN